MPCATAFRAGGRSHSRPRSSDHRPSRSQSPTTGPEFPTTSSRTCSSPSLPPSRTGRAWGCLSCARSSSPMAAGSRPPTGTAAARSSASPCRSPTRSRRDPMVPLIHIVDDDAAFRTAVARLLQAAGYRVALHESGDQLLDHPPASEPGCILLDMRMAGLSGLELQDRLSEQGVILPILFLTGYGDIPTSVRAIKAGAEDFLSKPVSRKTLLEAVERALARYEKAREAHTRLASLRALVDTLTPRESEVFALVVRGKLNKQIAYQLGTSERTVKAHRHAIMEKLRVQSLAEAVSIAERLGMLGQPSGRDKP